ncbi:family 78 glycoside hydrolase catalytic domain [Bacteroidota bacterium]
MSKILAVLFVITFVSCKHELQTNLILENLRCEMLTNPEGIDIVQPRLSWEIMGDQRNIEQTAYQIIVSSSIEKLLADSGDLWNSGKIKSNQSIHIQYNGSPLKSRMQCYWKVKIWANNGKSNWSKPAYWSMGLLHYKDWKGRWIGFNHAFPWEKVDTFSRLSARYFRKEFFIEKEIKRATANIIGLGLYELYINGGKAGNYILSPSPTDFTKNVKYNTYDVTNLLRNGGNAVWVILGNGRYFTMRQNYKPYKIKNFGFPKLLFQLEIEYSDGSSKIIKTDNSWKGTANGPIISNNEYDGEEYDARKEMPGWNKTGFNDKNWLDAVYVQEPGGEYEAQMNENMKIMDAIYPISITKINNDKYILDMGQNMVGWISFKAKGERGKKIKFRFAEKLKENGELFTTNLRDAKVTDIYTFKGTGEAETWEPKFVYHGFRYIEITNFPGIPTINDFVGKVIYDDINTTGKFETSNLILNQIYKNAWWSIAGNYKGMPVDCPQRNERQPWLGDRAIGSYGESFMFDNGRLYAKWLDDIRYTQKADGALCDVAPPYFKYYSDNMTWPGAYILVAEMLYNQFGDLSVINKNYQAMKKWLEYMQDSYMTEDYIVTKDSYGDWCAPPKTVEEGRGRNADKKRPSELISTAYYYHFMDIMQRFAEVTGNNQDIPEYALLAENIKNGFNKKFFHEDSNYYSDNSLTHNLLPFYFGMVTEINRSKVFENILKIIEIDNNGHLSTGLIGTQWLMRTLAENGRPDLSYRIATNTTYPSWGYMVKNGATAIWELWDGNTAGPNMNSYNHVMLLGDLIIWFYENLAGIKSHPEYPGFKKIIMNPSIEIGGLDSAKASYRTMHGLIKSEWKKEDGKLKWNITIPANTEAFVYFPTNLKNDIMENGGKATSAEGVKFVKKEADRIVFEVGSGNYKFIINNVTY